MSGPSGPAVQALRLTHDGWRNDDVADVRLLQGLLGEADPVDLRQTVHDLCRLAVGLAVLLEENHGDFTFDQWLADQALAGATGDAA